MSFNEKKFLSIISKTLRFGVMIFIILVFFAYAIKQFISIESYLLLNNIAIFCLIITPILRIMMLIYGFYKMKEYLNLLYSVIVFVIIISGIIIKF